jgi:hypothetical protein
MSSFIEICDRNIQEQMSEAEKEMAEWKKEFDKPINRLKRFFD